MPGLDPGGRVPAAVAVAGAPYVNHAPTVDPAAAARPGSAPAPTGPDEAGLAHVPRTRNREHPDTALVPVPDDLLRPPPIRTPRP